MATKTSKAPRQLSRGVQFVRVLWRPQYRGPVLAAVVGVAAIAGLIAAWNKWGAPATTSAEYVVTPDKLEITPQPAWIHADVKAEVVAAADLGRLDLRDPQLVEQVATAFTMHAWVAKVRRVQKRFPAHVAVTLDYRRPVAAVEITSRGQPGLLFVDAEGVLLPSDDFAQKQAKEFLRIAAANSTPAGVYGAPWGDDRVAGAARLAAAIGERWREAGLVRIEVEEAAGGELVYELWTEGQTRVIWGSSPGREAPREPSVEQKLTALANHIADKGPLDRPSGPRLIDLRALAVAPMTTNPSIHAP